MLLFDERVEPLSQRSHQPVSSGSNPLTHCCPRLKANVTTVAVPRLYLAISDLDLSPMRLAFHFVEAPIWCESLFPFNYPPDLLRPVSVRAKLISNAILLSVVPSAI